MNFDEPNLEELIQTDLRSEMSQILTQLEDSKPGVTPKWNGEASSGESPLGVFTSRNSHHGHREELVTQKGKDRDVEEPQIVHGTTCAIDSPSLLGQSQQGKIPEEHQQLSCQVSQESFAGFYEEIGTCPFQIPDHDDLQSLAWLTTVDVQALQKIVEPGTVTTSTINRTDQIDPNVLHGISDHLSVQMTAGESNNRTQTVYLKPRLAANPTKYIPIQPNPSRENLRFGPRRHPATRYHHPYPLASHAARREGTCAHGGPHVHSRYRQHPRHEKVYPKPAYSYSCLIAMALNNSEAGCLPVSEIYSFIMKNFPYFKSAPDGWKNSVRHNLSLNKCFEKVEKPDGLQKKGCLWALNPAKVVKMKEEVLKWKRKDPDAIRRSMSYPEELDRELEEVRRSDEEVARQKMLSLSSCGLMSLSSHEHHGHHRSSPTFHPAHHRGQADCVSSVLSGSASYPSTPQRCSGLHFSTVLAQQNFARTLARSASQSTLGRRNISDMRTDGSSTSQASAASINICADGNCNSVSAYPDLKSGTSSMTPGRVKSSFFTSSFSISSSSNTSLPCSFADCTTDGLGLEEDLNASISDLGGMHEYFWDDSLGSQPETSRAAEEPIARNDAIPIFLTEVGEDSPWARSIATAT